MTVTGAYEMLQVAIRSVADEATSQVLGVPAGNRASWYEQVCEMYRPAEIVAVQEYLHADPRTWLLCDVSGLMYFPEVFDQLLMRVKADCQSAGFDFDASLDNDGPDH